MKKVLIFYGSFGGGHLSTALALEGELKNRPNVETKTIDALKYVNKGVNKISTGFYNRVTRNSPWFWGKLYFSANKGPLNKVLYSSNSLMSNKLNKIINRFDADAVVCTHPFAAQTCVYLKEHGKLNANISVVITDYEIHSQWYSKHELIDHIFVGSTKMKDDLILKNVKPEKIHVTGIPVKQEFRQNFNKEEIFKSLSLDPSKKTFLFFGGGEFGLGKNLPLATLESALKIFDDSQFIVISGKNDRIYHNFKTIIKKQNAENRVALFKYSDRIPEFMNISTAVFSKPGGLTTTEATVSELPFVVFGPLPGQEYANTSFILDNEIGTFISTEDRIEYILENLKKNPYLFDEMKANFSKIAKPNSTIDVCDIILNNIKN